MNKEEPSVLLLTMRQYMFLKWLYNRKKYGTFCDLSQTNMQCFNCLNREGECRDGVIPASYFAKKLKRQYYDCKRVLDSLVELDVIKERIIDAKNYRVFYELTEKGIGFLDQFEEYYNLNNHIVKN